MLTVAVFSFSNQLLGFTPDIRNHPAIHYFRSGVPVVLGSDDSGEYPDFISYSNFIFNIIFFCAKYGPSPLQLVVLYLLLFTGTFGYDDFTIDWYEVFMAWGLDLAEMKQLAMNSILFSSMSDEEKQVNCKQNNTNSSL